MMMAGSGGTIAVIGNRMAIPAVGPIPGRMPTIVPAMLPMAQKTRLIGLNAFSNPIKSKEMVSTLKLFLKGNIFPKTEWKHEPNFSED